MLDFGLANKGGHDQVSKAHTFFDKKFRLDESKLALTLVDAGMVAQLTDVEAAVFIGILASLGSGSGREAAMFALQFSEDNYHNLSEETKENFTNDMLRLFDDCCRGYGTAVDVGEVLRGVLGTFSYGWYF